MNTFYRTSFILPLLITGLIAPMTSNEDISIIIIGAGASGLAAATRLLQNNFTNLVILEAEDRIGGKIYTVPVDNAFADLGAHFVHGQKGNVVFDLVKDKGILNHNNHEPHMFYSNGEEVKEDLRSAILDFEENTLDQYEVSPNKSVHVSIADYFTKKYNKELLALFKEGSEEHEIASCALKTLANDIMSYEGSFNWRDSSIEMGYLVTEGDLEMNWNGHGYKTILEVLMDKHKGDIENKLKLLTEVNRIEWNENGKEVIVKSKDKEYKANHVIFTASLGVLKRYHNQLFSPSLDDQKQDAIDSIGMGGVMHVMLHFEEPFWGPDEKSFYLVWSKEDAANIAKEYPYGPIVNGKSWLEHVTYLATVEGTPKLLLAYVSGEMVPRIEKESDNVIENGIMYCVKKFLGKKFAVKRPDYMLRSEWYSNRHFLGAYSFDTVYRRPGINYREILAEPLYHNESVPVILFGGEATHQHYYGTVHGAIETGFREADRIIDFYNNNYE